MSDKFELQYRILVEDGIAAFNVQPLVIDYLAQRHLAMPERPVMSTLTGTQLFTGQLPPDLTRITDDELGTLLNNMSRWREFIQNELSIVHNAFAQHEAIVEHLDAQLFLLYKHDHEEKKRTEGERKSCMLADRRYVEAKRNCLYYESIYRIVRGMAASADKNWETVSRRITQRQQDLEKERRGVAIGNLGQQSPLFRR